MRRLTELNAEAVRLRLQERLSLREIQSRTGASRGSLSSWLREFPLTEEEKRRKHDEKRRLRGKRPRKGSGEASRYHQMAEANQLSWQQRARCAEAAILFRLCLHGFHAFGAIFEGIKTDWLVVDEATHRTLRIEVRCVKRSGRYGAPTISLRCSAGRKRCRRLRQDEFDFLVGYDLLTDTAFVYSATELAQRKMAVVTSDDAAERWDKLQAP